MPIHIQLCRPDASLAWGFRLQGGRDFGQPVVISAVNPDGLADQHGLCPGDRVLAIGGDATYAFTHQQAQQAVIRCGNELTFEVVRGDLVSSPTRDSGPGNLTAMPTPPASSQYYATGGDFYHAQSVNQPAHPRTTMRSQVTLNMRPGATVSTASGVADVAQPRTSVFPTGSGLRLTSAPPYKPQPSTGYISSSLKHAIAASQATPLQARPGLDVTPTPARPAHMQSAHPFGQRASGSKFDSSPSPGGRPSRPEGSGRSPVNRLSQSQVHRGEAGDVLLHHESVSGSAERPICFTCKATIRGPYLTALNHYFCPDHFTCGHCKKRLTQSAFVKQKGEFFCEADFTAYLAPRCAKCAQPVVGTVVTALERQWHSGCFVCLHCQKPINDSTFRVADDDGQVYCEEDWQQLFQVKCGKCDKPIEEIDRFLEAFGKRFHAVCFTCAACMCPLEGKPFHARDGKAFCRAHAHAVAVFG